MSQLILTRGSPFRAGYLYTDNDPNLSSVDAASILDRGGELELASLTVAFVASADVGTRTLRMQIRDADGETRHSRVLGSVVASGTLDASLPFAYPHPYLDNGESVIPSHVNAGGSVNATSAAINLTATLLDTWYGLYAEAAPASYPVPRGTRVYGVSSVVVKDATDSTTYVEGDDYDVDYVRGKVRALTGGDITATDSLVIDFNYAGIVYREVDRGNEPIKLKAGWDIVVEDTADIEDTNDDLDVFFNGRQIA